jgi:His-Xaa-Ser system protein HxsD
MADGVARIDNAVSPVTSRPHGVIALEIDRALFSMDALLKAAYKFADRCYVFIQTHETRTDRWLVMMRPKDAAHTSDQLGGDFSNELIDQRLRERLEQQFGDVRTLIVAQAFAEGNLLDADRSGDYQTDPRGIGRLRP